MTPIVLDAPVRWWHCPACDLRDRTQQAGVHTQFHNCAALGGIGIPLIEVPSYDARADGRQRPVESEDYIGGNGQPITAVRTERGDGSNDCTVLAPTASIHGGAIQPAIPGTPVGRKDCTVSPITACASGTSQS
jgi:hypothetical protein